MRVEWVCIFTGAGCVVTGKDLPDISGSIPTNTPPATWKVRVSVDVRMKISCSLTLSKNPSFSW